MAIIIDSPDFPDSLLGSYTPFIEVSFDQNTYGVYYPHLANIDYASTKTVVISNPSGAMPLPNDWRLVLLVVANGKSLTPAVNPVSPTAGEFFYNPYTNTVQIYLNEVIPSIVVYGS